MIKTLRTLTVISACALLGACGFHLRGQSTLPYETMYISAGPSSVTAALLKRTIEAQSEARVTDKADEAQVVLHVLIDSQTKEILSLNSAGRVREFQLLHRFGFRISGAKGEQIAPPQQVLVKRDVTFSDDRLLAKEQEQEIIYREMREDVVQQVMRRLQAISRAKNS